MPSPIVVATDFSTRSDRALRRSSIIAKRTGAELLLVHVVDNDQPQYIIDAEVDASSSLLDEATQGLCSVDSLSAGSRVIVGDVYSGLLEVAEEADASLLVLGPHRRLLRDAFIGTTAERVIAHSERPVLLAAGVPAAPYPSALIALEMDDVSECAVVRLLELSIVEPSTLVALHAFDAPAEGMMRRAMSETDAIAHYLRAEGRSAAKEFKEFLDSIGLAPARQVVVPIRGTAAGTILEAAASEDVSLVIVGTSQKTGIRRMVLGSVAEDVLGNADRDVLVIPEG